MKAHRLLLEWRFSLYALLFVGALLALRSFPQFDPNNTIFFVMVALVAGALGEITLMLLEMLDTLVRSRF